MKQSAGILLYRRKQPDLGFPQPSPCLPAGKPQPSFELLLVHPGGPYWAGKDEHAWSIIKGEIGETGEAGNTEELEKTARREFEEETGMTFNGALTPLPPVKTPGKIIHAFLGEGDFDPATLKSNFFEMEWPPKSGRMQSFPEVDKAQWFDFATAKTKIHKGQIRILELVTFPST